jgi:parallel beta-helix repeat protein
MVEKARSLRTGPAAVMTMLMAVALLLALTILAIFPAPAQAYSICSQTGCPNDCEQIGTWDEATKTCTLNRDLDQGLTITDGIFGSYVTIDGGGHTLKGGGTGIGVSTGARWSHDYTIKNLRIENFDKGIYVNMSNHDTITGNTIVSNATGMYIFGMTSPSPSENGSSYQNRIFNNNFIDNGTHLMDLFYTYDQSPETPPVISHPTGNHYNLDAPIGGNYWSGWIGPDDDHDGFVDTPYVIAGEQKDLLPWVRQDGWLCRTPTLSLSVANTYWSSYADYAGRNLSVDFTVAVAGDVPANGLEVMETGSTNGVFCVNAQYQAIGDIGAGTSGSFTKRFTVPETVRSFQVRMQARVLDSCGDLREIKL